MARLVGLFMDTLSIAISTLRKILPMAWRLATFVIRELLGGIAVWIRTIPSTCDLQAEKWERAATQAGIGGLTKPIYYLMYLLTFIEIVAVTVILAHILVFGIFWIFLL